MKCISNCLFVLLFICTICSCQKQNGTNNGRAGGHEYVDLGLSVKWSTCNVGASSPAEYGEYFAWGEIETKLEYDNSTYSIDNLDAVGDIAGNPLYDAARANWGGKWRLPTPSEIEELVDNCKWVWTMQGGHNGYEVSSINGNSIFIPAAGEMNGTSVVDADKFGGYWSATHSLCLCFRYNTFYRGGGHSAHGMQVRPVLD